MDMLEVINKLKLTIKEFPEDYAYEKPEEEGDCAYFLAGHTTPRCLIGELLVTELGVVTDDYFIFEERNNESARHVIKVLIDEGVLGDEWLGKPARLLDICQRFQDQGMPWHEVVRTIEAAVIAGHSIDVIARHSHSHCYNHSDPGVKPKECIFCP